MNKTLEIPITERWFRFWGLSHIRRLFLLLAAVAFVAVLGTRIPAVLMYSSAGLSLSLGGTALVLLLLGIHVHYIMVRSNASSLNRLRPSKSEYLSLVHDILYHEEFMRLKEFFHHNGHIYDHVVRVSYLSYSVSKVFSLDYSAAARGGLLHDFFLYDWRERKAQDLSRWAHGREHPQIAYANASRCFSVNAREKDIIVKHMFPKTRSFPRFTESYIVSASDKVAAIGEFCQRQKALQP